MTVSPRRFFDSDRTAPIAVVPYEEHTMRTRRIFRSLMVAGAAAALSVLSVVSAVMAASGGADFPK